MNPKQRVVIHALLNNEYQNRYKDEFVWSDSIRHYVPCEDDEYIELINTLMEKGYIEKEDEFESKDVLIRATDKGRSALYRYINSIPSAKKSSMKRVAAKMDALRPKLRTKFAKPKMVRTKSPKKRKIKFQRTKWIVPGSRQTINKV